MARIVGKAALGAAMLIAWSLAWSQPDSLRKANELVKQGNPSAALEILRPLKEANAQNAEYQYLLGIAALDSGDLDLAIESLREAVRIKPDLAQAHAELARAYMLFGNLFLAHLEMERAKSLNPPPEVVAAMDKFVDEYHRSVYAGRKRFAGNVSAGIGHDSNVNAATSAQSVTLPILGGIQATLGPTARKQSDSFSIVSVEVGGFVPLSQRTEAVGAASASAKINGSVDQFDVGNLTVAGGLRFLRDERNQFSLVANAETLSLDNRRVRDTSGVTADWRHIVHPLVEAGVFAQQSRLTYVQERFRDVDRTVFGFTLTPAAVGRRLNNIPPMFVVYAGEEQTLDPTVPHLGHRLWGVRVGDIHYFTTRLASFQGLTYESRNYRGPDPLFVTTREDRQWDLTLGLLYKVTKDFTLIPLLSYTQNRSNLDVFKYDRTAVSVSLRYVF